ncbi:MAG: hypothetical protein K0S12_1134, partial [Bacteroidetes bacterium]|nr:hypothetical protein [Bacteroidota bacterium]
VSVSGSKPIITALHRVDLSQMAYDNTIKGIYDYCQGQNKYPQNFFALHSANIRRLSVKNDLEFENGLPVVNSDITRTRSLEPRIKYKDVWATHPSLQDREGNANRTVVASDIMTNSPWELFKDPQEVQERLSKCITELQVTEKEILSNDVLEAYFEHEEREDKLNPIYKDYYSYSANTAELPLSDARDEISSLGTADLFNEEIILKLRQYQHNVMDTQTIKSISEGHLEVKRFEFDGKPYTRYYSSEIYQTLKKETEEQETALKAHQQKVVTWFYQKSLSRDAYLAKEYKGVLSLRHALNQHLQSVIGVFNTTVAFYEKELTVSFSEEDVPHLRKSIKGFYDQIHELIQKSGEVPIPDSLLTDGFFLRGYKDVVFVPKPKDPSDSPNLDGFVPFTNSVQELIRNMAAVDVKLFRTGLKQQDEILKLL